MALAWSGGILDWSKTLGWVFRACINLAPVLFNMLKVKINHKFLVGSSFNIHIFQQLCIFVKWCVITFVLWVGLGVKTSNVWSLCFQSVGSHINQIIQLCVSWLTVQTTCWSINQLGKDWLLLNTRQVWSLNTTNKFYETWNMWGWWWDNFSRRQGNKKELYFLYMVPIKIFTHLRSFHL